MISSASSSADLRNRMPALDSRGYARSRVIFIIAHSTSPGNS
jgi:hypothetical protein